MLLPSHMSHGAEHPQARDTGIYAAPYSLLRNTQQALSVDTTEMLRHLDLIVAMDIAFAYRPLGVRDKKSGQWLRSIVDHREQLNTRVHIGLWSRADLGVEIPFIFNQSAQFAGAKLGSVEALGLGDMGLYTKIGLFGPHNKVGLAIANELRLPTGRDDAWMTSDTVTSEPAVILSRAAGPSHVSFRFGYRFKENSRLFDIEDGDRITFGLAARYRFPMTGERLSASVETTGALRADDPTSGISENGAQWGGGLSMAWTPAWHTGLITGGGLTQTFNTPAFRCFLSIEYRHAFRQHPPDCRRVDAYRRDGRCPAPDSDRDGIPDHTDRCVRRAEDKDGYEDNDGCPDTDNDKDGIEDTKDKCPNKAEDKDGFQDADGCPDPDNDQDGILDKADKCPLKAETHNQYEDTDGCPEIDTDGDTIVDPIDKCPEEVEDKDGFEDEDGCPDIDNDDDGIHDKDDRCPNQPEKMNGYKDEDGCPDEELAVKTNSEIVITEEIYFLLGQVVPRKRSRRVLRAVHKVLQKHPQIRVLVEGHTDGHGGETFNRYLSQARAQAIKDILVRLSTDPKTMRARLEVIGLGSSAPKGSPETKAGRAKSRRVRFIIIADR